MKTVNVVWVVVVAFVLGGFVGSALNHHRPQASRDSVLGQMPLTDTHSIEIYRPADANNVLIAETLIVDSEARPDRPVWRITFASHGQNPRVYYAQPATR